MTKNLLKGLLFLFVFSSFQASALKCDETNFKDYIFSEKNTRILIMKQEKAVICKVRI